MNFSSVNGMLRSANGDE